MAPLKPDGRYSHVEVETRPTEAESDRATLQAIKGGFALKFSSHFAVALIVGIAAALAGHHSAPLPEAQELAVRHLTEDVAALRGELGLLKAQVEQTDKNTEWKLNELLTRK